MEGCKRYLLDVIGFSPFHFKDGDACHVIVYDFDKFGDVLDPLGNIHGMRPRVRPFGSVISQ
jgi:hypothetical protein